jgi:hypothetical protein
MLSLWSSPPLLTLFQPPPYLWQDQHYLSAIAEDKRTKLKHNNQHLIWREELNKHKFPQCAPANLETSRLLEIGDRFSETAVASFLGVSTP